MQGRQNSWTRALSGCCVRGIVLVGPPVIGAPDIEDLVDPVQPRYSRAGEWGRTPTDVYGPLRCEDGRLRRCADGSQLTTDQEVAGSSLPSAHGERGSGCVPPGRGPGRQGVGRGRWSSTGASAPECPSRRAGRYCTTRSGSTTAQPTPGPPSSGAGRSTARASAPSASRVSGAGRDPAPRPGAGCWTTTRSRADGGSAATNCRTRPGSGAARTNSSTTGVPPDRTPATCGEAAARRGAGRCAGPRGSARPAARAGAPPSGRPRRAPRSAAPRTAGRRGRSAAGPRGSGRPRGAEGLRSTTRWIP